MLIIDPYHSNKKHLNIAAFLIFEGRSYYFTPIIICEIFSEYTINNRDKYKNKTQINKLF